MDYLKYFLLSLFIISTCFANNDNDESKIIKSFDKKNIAWANAKRVKSKNRRLKPASSKEPARLWFQSTPGAKDSYSFALKDFSVKTYDYILIEYRIMPYSFLTIDVAWDKTNRARPLYSIKGNGKWQTLKLPVQGETLKIYFNLKSNPNDKTSRMTKVYFKPIKGLKDSSVLNCKLYKIDTPILIPEPKKYKFTAEKIPLVIKGKAAFSVHLNSQEPELKHIIAKEIADYLKLNKNLIIGKSSKNTVINLEFGTESSIIVPPKKEAYSIKFSKSKNQNIITFAAKDKAGLYWAWQSFRQLIEKNANSVKVNICDINDWPDFEVRSLNAYGLEQEKRNLALKLNYSAYSWWKVRGRMWNLPQSYIEIIEKMCEYALARGTNAVQWLGPFYEKQSINVSDNKQIDELFKAYEISLKTGNRACFLGIDDGGRIKNSFTSADQKAYNNDRLLSHAYFIKKMSDKIYSKYPNSQIFVCTKDYENAKGITTYYDRIGVSKNIIISWTGVQSVTFNYPGHIINKYEKGIEGRRYCIYDNTPGQAHGMRRGLLLCEKYASGYKNLIQSKKCIGIQASCTLDNQMRMIFGASIAEYLWNASRYDAERARQRAIAKVAGNAEAVKPILLFTQEYLKIAYKYPIDKRIRPKKDFILEKGIRQAVGHKKLKKREVAKYSIDSEEYKKLCIKIAFMSNIMKKIEQKSKNKMLTGEFKLFYRNMKEIIDYLHKNSIPAPLIEAEGIYTFDMNRIPGGINYKERGTNKQMSAVIYGNQTANNIFTVTFKLKELSTKNNCTIKLAGWDCDKSIPTMMINVNGHKVFSGKTTFGHTYPYKTGPGKMNISVPAKYLLKGKNIIKIINNAPVSDLIDNWIILAGIKLKF